MEPGCYDCVEYYIHGQWACEQCDRYLFDDDCGDMPLSDSSESSGGS